MAQVERSIRIERLLRRGQKALIGVSGGVDSMVLLHVLHRLAGKFAWRLAVAHLNHGLRGSESDEDERFVQRAAAALNLLCVAETIDVARIQQTSKASLEMAARVARHEFLARTAKRIGMTTVALAHQADDQVELFFLRLLRGAGGEGLGGMKWSSPSPGDARVRLIRPLLDLESVEVEAFARAEKIPYRDDSSNANTDILRNRVRVELLPRLRARFQPALNKTTLRAMEIIGAEADFVARAAAAWLGAGAEQGIPFQTLHPAVQRQVIQSQLHALGTEVSFELIERLRQSADQPQTIAPGVRLSRDEVGRLTLERTEALDFSRAELPVEIVPPAGRLDWDGMRLGWQVMAGTRGMPLPKFQAGSEFFDLDKVGGAICVRHWRPGDRFQPIGMPKPVKLQDLLTNLKVPAAKRRRLLVAATSAGELFWVEGLRISERFKLDKRTNRWLKWYWSRVG